MEIRRYEMNKYEYIQELFDTFKSDLALLKTNSENDKFTKKIKETKEEIDNDRNDNVLKE